MAETLTTDEVARLVNHGAQLLEVLPASAYDGEHLPGAVNIDLPSLTRQAAGQLDPDRPVVVYCYDTECDLSARGAAVLEAYGFSEVYDYTGSKTEWLGLGHPYEGDISPSTKAGALADTSVPTCAADATVGDLGEPSDAGPLTVVLTEDRVVLGTVRTDQLTAGASTPVVDVMAPGPSTVRPSITAEELAQSMDEAGQGHVIVSTLDGKLIGLVRRDALTLDA
jgi:rhodanese-related sulfurtransferase/CBS domain-containing protein